MNNRMDAKSKLFLICLAFLWCGYSNLGFGQDGSSEINAAMHLLSSNKVIQYPFYDLGLLDKKQRDVATALFNGQLQAIRILKNNALVSAVPILIPYLNYTIDGKPIYMRQTSVAEPAYTIERLRKECPAFDAILTTPGSSTALQEYASNQDNPLDCRVASVVVLRYIDKIAFESAFEFLAKDKMLKAAGPKTKYYLETVKSGKAMFVGIYPLKHLDDDEVEQ